MHTVDVEARAKNSDVQQAKALGRWLLLARLLWAFITLLALAHFVSLLPLLVALADTNIFLTAYPLAVSGMIVILPLIYYAVAGVIAWRRFDDWMGLFVSLMLICFGTIWFSYTTYGNPAGTVDDPLLWRRSMNAIVRAVAWVSFFIFFLVFPNGRFVPRWTSGLAVIWAGYTFAWLVFPQTDPHMTRWGAQVLTLLITICPTVGALVQLYRYTNVANAVERQQTKWVVFGCLAAFLGNVGGQYISQIGDSRGAFLSGLAIHLLAFLLIPGSIGVAVLRYRLWDIDPILNRGLVYGLLSAVLLLVYIGSVVLFQGLFRPLIGPEHDVATVASTLTVAALFQPLRRRIQAFIDRRFYRRRYDAARIVQAFGAQLRDEVDLEHLTDDLVAVVGETLQPAHVSVWLRRLDLKK